MKKAICIEWGHLPRQLPIAALNAWAVYIAAFRKESFVTTSHNEAVQIPKSCSPHSSDQGMHSNKAEQQIPVSIATKGTKTC